MPIGQFLIDWVKIPLLGELKLIKPQFGDMGLSTSDSILGLLSSMLKAFFTFLVILNELLRIKVKRLQSRLEALSVEVRLVCLSHHSRVICAFYWVTPVSVLLSVFPL